MAALAEIVEDLECRATRKIRLFGDGEFPLNATHFEWLACSSKFGIGLAVLPNNQIVSYQLANIHALPKSSEAGDPEISDLPSRKTSFFKQETQISFVRLSCNQRVVAFGTDTPGGAFVYIFDIFAFSPVSEVQPFPLATIKASSGNGKITCLEWNPEAEDLFTVGTTDGSLATIKYSLDNRLNFSIVAQITMQNHPTCLCWSPKGKQLSVGDTTGRLHQLKPELTNVRQVDAPQQIQGLNLPVQCAGLYWLANTDWLIVYRQHDDPLRLTLALLTVKKNQPPVWAFFSDLTFQRPNAPRNFDTAFHFVPLMQWNMVFIFAHRSPDFAVVGQRNGNWMTFVMEKYNISMPTSPQKSDTYPIGAYFDFTCSNNVTLDYGNAEAPTLTPQPMLHVLSSGGLLLPYHICSLDRSRPSLIESPSAFSAQNIMNGPQPANYQLPQTIKQEPSTQVENQRQQATSTGQVPISTGQKTIPNQAQPPTLAAPPKEAAQTVAQKEQEALANAQSMFEKSLVNFAQTKGQLIQNLEAFSVVQAFLNEKSNNFDVDCIDTLWELSEKVHFSIDDGIQTVDKASRKSASLISHLKQSENIWQKHLITGNQRKRSVVPSSMLEDLSSIDRRMQQAELKTEAIEAVVNEAVEKLTPKEDDDLPAPTQPVSPADQTRINKVNDAIAKKVAQFTNRVISIQQQLKFLQVYAQSKDTDRFSEDPAEQIIPSRPPQPAEPVGSLANDIKRLLLIVDGEDDCSPFSPKPKQEEQEGQEKREEDRDEGLTQSQIALKNIFEERTDSATIRRVCPKKLVVDEAPVMKSTPLRSRTFEVSSDVKDEQLKQQVEAAKQTIVQAKANASFGGLNTSFGTNIDSAAILSAVKSSADADKPSPVQPVVSSTQKQPAVSSTQSSIAPKTANFSFAQLGKSIAAESEQSKPSAVPPTTTQPAVTPSNFSFKKDEAAQPVTTPSNFSFKKDDSAVKTQVEATPAKNDVPTQATSSPVKNEFSNQPQATSTPNSFSFSTKKDDGGLSSAFGDMSATGNQPKTQSDPSKPTPVAFSFAPKTSDTSAQQNTNAGAQPSEIKPTNFSFAPQQATQSSVQPNQPSSGPVSFSFAPKSPQQPSSAFGGGTGFGQQSTGWSSFGGAANSENKSAFGGSTQSGSGSGFGGGFSSFGSQNKSGAFGQATTQQQSSGFGQGPTQQSSGFGSGGFGSNQQQSTGGFGQQSTGSFGQQSTGGFGQQSTGGFGSTQQSSGGFGSGSSFGGSAQQSSGFGQQTSGFGSGPSFGGSAFGSKPAFGSAASANTNTGFGSTAGGFSAFANKGSSFGQLAQQAQTQPSGFGSPQQQSSPFGSGFGSPASSFGSAFNTPQQSQSSAFTTFRK